MLAPKLRLTLAIVSFALGVYLVLAGREYTGLLLFAGSALLGYGYSKYNTVWLAFREVAHGRVAPAAKLLAQVKRPEALASGDRAYFELASGLVSASQADNGRAEAHLRCTLDHALRTDNDRALAEAVLAQLLAARGELEEARRIVAQAARRSCRPAIATRIQAIQRELAAPPAA